MTPMFGLIASSISGNLSTNSYESIATVTVGSGGQSSVSFTSIPSTYKHLQIRAIGRRNDATGIDDTLWRFNSDSGSNYYTFHQLRGNGAAASASANGSGTTFDPFVVTSLAETSNNFAAVVVDILDYQNTNKYKTVRSLGGYDNNGSGSVFYRSALWQSTSAVNQIDITVNGGVNLLQYSQFALYGVKG